MIRTHLNKVEQVFHGKTFRCSAPSNVVRTSDRSVREMNTGADWRLGVDGCRTVDRGTGRNPVKMAFVSRKARWILSLGFHFPNLTGTECFIQFPSSWGKVHVKA